MRTTHRRHESGSAWFRNQLRRRDLTAKRLDAGATPGKGIAQSVGLWLACLCVLAQPRTGSCFGLVSASPEPSGFSEIIGSPADHWWWDVNTITYKFDASFDVLFPDASIKNQVRLAFKQWDQAFNTA